MLSAKLFAALALLQTGWALFERETSHRSFDIYFHATYFVIGKIHVVVLLALTSACFALIYFAASRWLRHPLNSAVGLLHVVLSTITFSIFLVCMSSLGFETTANHHWRLLACLVGVACFLAGWAVLVMNCIWTAVRYFRPGSH